MRFFSSFRGRASGLWLLCGALALPAVAGTKWGAAPRLGQAPEAPVEQLIIQYQDNGPAEARQAGAAALSAGRRVARSAAQAQVPGLHYLRSVSPRLHVARLDQALPADQAQALLQRLRADPAVVSVAVDRRVRRATVPTDPYFAGSAMTAPFQWHLQSSSSVPGGINAGAAWAGSTGTGVVVAVLDGGYRPHADLVGNLARDGSGNVIGHDFILDLWTANDGDARDADALDPGDWVPRSEQTLCAEGDPQSSWHGTHVAGLLGATANGSEGVGVAFGARVLPVRVLGRCGGYESDVLMAARWAAGLAVDGIAVNPQPARVLNLSLAVDGGCASGAQEVVDEIRRTGVSIVAAAGNGSETSIGSPANCKGVVAVTAHTRAGDSADYANVGLGVSISAPGGDGADPIVSTQNTGLTGPDASPGGDTWGGMYGTSMAAPMVSGVLALMAAARPDLPMASLEGLLRDTARGFPNEGYCQRNPDGLAPGFCGAGLLDAGAAVTAAQAAAAGQADLELGQRMVSGTVAAGEVVTYAIVLRNWGAVSAAGLTVQGTVSADLVIQSVSTSTKGVTASHNGSTLSATLPSLAPDGELQLNVTVRVNGNGARWVAARVDNSVAETSLDNNEDRLVLVTVDSALSVASGAGGGCTVAPTGQADAGLPLLALVAALALLWRRRGAG